MKRLNVAEMQWVVRKLFLNLHSYPSGCYGVGSNHGQSPSQHEDSIIQT